MPNLPYKSNATIWDNHTQVGTVRFDFPFVDDFSVYTVTRSYMGPLSTYAAPVLGTADATYTSHRLVAQSALEPGDGGTVRYTRTWAPIPADRLTYAARLFARPRLHDLVVSGGLGSIYAASFDDDTSTLFFARVSALLGAISAPTKSVAGTVSKSLAAITPDTWPAVYVTLKGSGLAAFYTSTSAAGIKSACESGTGLTVAVSKSATDLVLRILTGTLAYVECNDSRVQLTSDSTSVVLRLAQLSARTEGTDTPAVTETYNVPTALRTVSATGLNAAAGDWLAAWSNNKLVGLAQVVTAPDANSATIKADESPWAVGSLTLTHVALAKNGLRLVHGAKDCSIRTPEKFYLPGVTTGITTGADVPSVPLYTDPIAWLGRLAATTLTSVTATAATDKLTKTAHGLATGDIFFLLAQSGAAGLATLTPYYAIRSDADNLKAATSHDNARLGTAIDITSDGSGLTLLVPAPYAAIAVSDLRAWMGPILTKSYDEVQLLDAIEWRSASA